MKALDCLFGAVLFFAIGLSSVQAAQIVTGSEASQVLRVQDLKVTPDQISGTIVNASPHIVRDVELLIQYHWLWNNEFHPGSDSPGQAITVTLDKELRPGESVPFSYTPSPPLPRRNDGRFMPEITVAGFTVIIPQRTATR